MEENTRARNDDYLTKYIILIIIHMFSDDCEHILTYIASSMKNEEGEKKWLEQ